MDEFDVIVLGAGSGGYTAAIRASQLGRRTALVEEEKVGGVCLHRGCIPTKLLLESAEVLSLLRRSRTFGIEAERIRLDYSLLAQRKERVVETLHKNLRGVIGKQKVEIVQGRGRLLSPTRVAVDGRELEAGHIVIATGSRPAELPGLPCDGARILHSDHVLALQEPPRSLLVVGAGAVGLEFASFFLDVGSEVTVIEMLPRLLPMEDADLGRTLQRILEGRGARVLTGARVLPERTRLFDEMVELTVEHEGEEKALRGSHVLVATGRQGNVEGIGLENTRVEVEGGFIRVDPHMRTAEPTIYAVGDVIGGPLLAHVAAAEGVVAAEAIAGREPPPLDYLRIPRAVYTRPQVAAVGLSEEQARERGHRVKTQRFSFRYNAMALIQDETEGFAKVVIDADSGDLLGAHVIGPSAVELVSEAALARYLDVSVWELATSVRPHPSLSEVLGEAAQLSAGISIYW